MNWPHDLLTRIEDVSLNASAPPEQRWIDGWLVRYSPGKARRARSINAVAPGRLPIAEKLALAIEVFEQANLTPHARITPFSQPAGLDAELAARGWVVADPTIVMVRALAPSARGGEADLAAPPAGLQVRRADAEAFARVVGELRGSAPTEIDAHATRLKHSPVPYVGAVLWDGPTAVACAQTARESNFVGLYDVFTAAPWRGQRLASWLCERLLIDEASRGASIAYLQVAADNVPAQAVYRKLGFSAGYQYHYRTPPERAARPAGAS